jgi:hypothetical protein
VVSWTRVCVTLFALCRNLLTISAFYGLPVVQLVFVWSTQVADGNQDLCWYNHLCARPFGPVYAFNAVFSNIGYVALGFLFVLITAHKHVRHVNSVISPDTGEPRRPLNVCCRVRARIAQHRRTADVRSATSFWIVLFDRCGDNDGRCTVGCLSRVPKSKQLSIW